jgi:hypothetical protein
MERGFSSANIGLREELSKIRGDRADVRESIRGVANVMDGKSLSP